MVTRSMLVLVGGLLVAGVAHAQPAPGPATGAPPAKQVQAPPSRKPNVPELVGATEIVKLTASGGFIDDAVATDDTRIAYVVADATSKAELHVYTVASKTEVVIDLAPVTLAPVELAFVGKARVLVIGRTDDGNRMAALVELDPKAKKPVVFKTAPAVDMSIITRDGVKRLAVHAVGAGAGGAIRHAVELLSLDTGKRVGALRALEVAEDGTNAKLGFRVNHWSEGYSKAHGIKQGEWDRKENERAPDFEATYDLVTGKFVDKQKITDLFEQRRRFQTLATESAGRTDIVRVSWDNATVQLWRAGKLRTVELDQSIAQYDPKSLQGTIAPDGSAWLMFKVDPTNPEAIGRKKADPQYVDIFRVPADGKTATRKARVLAHDVRMRFGAIGDKFWLVERNNGFERGGKWLALYQPS